MNWSSFILPLAYALVLYFLLDLFRKKQLPSLSRPLFSGFYLIKLLMAFALTALYTFYYDNREDADIYKFFDDSLVIHQIAFQDFPVYLKLLFGFDLNINEHRLILDTQHWDAGAEWGSSSHRLITRFHLFFHWISFSNVWVHALLFNALSVLGFLWLFKLLKKYFHYSALILLAFLMPSVVFWSSGMLKEALLIFFFGILAVACFRFLKGAFFSAFILVVVGIVALFILKKYILLALLPVLIAAFLSNYSILQYKRAVWSFLLALPLGYFLVEILFKLFRANTLRGTLVKRYNEFLELAMDENAGSLLTDTPARTDQMFALLGQAFKNTFLMPWPWTDGGLLIKLAGLEQFAFYLLFGSALVLLFKMRFDIPKPLILVFCLLFVISLFLLIGMTVPVLGAIVRYKMPAVLFAAIAFLYVWDVYLGKEKK